MKAKTARRKINRSIFKLARKKVESTGWGILKSRRTRKRYAPVLKTLKADQKNPASDRAYQKALHLLS